MLPADDEDSRRNATTQEMFGLHSLEVPHVCSGSCAITYEEEIGGPVTTEHEYFAKALELHDQCDVLVSCILSANVPCCSMALHKGHVAELH